MKKAVVKITITREVVINCEGNDKEIMTKAIQSVQSNGLAITNKDYAAAEIIHKFDTTN